MRSNDRLRNIRLQGQTQWRDFVEHRHTKPETSWLAHSWQVSAESVNVAQIAAPMADPDSVRAQFIDSALYKVSEPVLVELQNTLQDIGFAIGLSDAFATLQWTASNRQMARRLEKTHFIPSARWDELSMGTNAVGVAARLARPTTVFSAEHYIPSLHDWVCYAAPIMHANDGRVLGVLDISAPWQAATPMALATVNHYAQLIAKRWSESFVEPQYRLHLCGAMAGCLDGSILPKRLQEIFLVLALHPEGLSLDGLHAHVYGDAPVSTSTLKSEITHLRTHIGEILQARPYRLVLSTGQYATDTQLIEYYALRGQIHELLALYQRPLLPLSVSPAVAQYRDYLHQLVTRAVVASSDVEALWQFARTHEPEYVVLHALMNHLPADDGRRNAVLAMLDALD